MELINRSYQRELLEALANKYPQWVDVDELPNAEGNKRSVNLFYIGERDLVELKLDDDLSNAGGAQPALARITADGVDFLQDDGGLKAVLNVVTVRIHPDTLRDLLIKRVQASKEDDPTVRQNVIEKLKQLPAEGIGVVTTRILEAGLERVPGLAQIAWAAMST